MRAQTMMAATARTSEVVALHFHYLPEVVLDLAIERWQDSRDGRIRSSSLDLGLQVNIHSKLVVQPLRL